MRVGGLPRGPARWLVAARVGRAGPSAAFGRGGDSWDRGSVRAAAGRGARLAGVESLRQLLRLVERVAAVHFGWLVGRRPALRMALGHGKGRRALRIPPAGWEVPGGGALIAFGRRDPVGAIGLLGCHGRLVLDGLGQRLVPDRPRNGRHAEVIGVRARPWHHRGDQDQRQAHGEQSTPPPRRLRAGTGHGRRLTGRAARWLNCAHGSPPRRCGVVRAARLAAVAGPVPCIGDTDSSRPEARQHVA
jgi:hypothetical protein